MSDSVVNCPDITIANGATASSIIKSHEVYDDAVELVIFGDTTLDAIVHRIQVSYDQNATAASDWFDLYEGNPPVQTLAPLVNTVQSYYQLCGYPAFRIVAASAVGGLRTFKLRKKTRTS